MSPCNSEMLPCRARVSIQLGTHRAGADRKARPALRRRRPISRTSAALRCTTGSQPAAPTATWSPPPSAQGSQGGTIQLEALIELKLVKPSSSSTLSFRVVRVIPFIESIQFPVEQFEATVSQSTVSCPLLNGNEARVALPPAQEGLTWPGRRRGVSAGASRYAGHSFLWRCFRPPCVFCRCAFCRGRARRFGHRPLRRLIVAGEQQPYTNICYATIIQFTTIDGNTTIIVKHHILELPNK